MLNDSIIVNAICLYGQTATKRTLRVRERVRGREKKSQRKHTLAYTLNRLEINYFTNGF